LRHGQRDEGAVGVLRPVLRGFVGLRLVGELGDLLEQPGGVLPDGALGLPLVGRVHHDHADVAAQRDGLEAVLGLPPRAGQQRGAEADHVLGDPHPEQLRGHQVAQLVQSDRQGQSQAYHRDAEPEQQHGQRSGAVSSACAALRAHASTASRASTPPARSARGRPGCSSTARISPVMPRKSRSPVKNASTASSFTALYTAIAPPPSRWAARARAIASKVSSSTGSKVQDWAVRKPSAAASRGSFSGWASAQPMAWRMSGGLACAMVEPSTSVTIECTIDWGWTTTSTRSSGRSNWKQASITSSALLTRVAEF